MKCGRCAFGNDSRPLSSVNFSRRVAPDACRHDSGKLVAGPVCKFAPGCQNIATQSLDSFSLLGKVAMRVIAVDGRPGIVWLRMAWGARESGGDQLNVWETFKTYDGKIHAVGRS